MREKRKIVLEIGINVLFIAIAIGMFIVSKNYKLVRGTLLGARTFPLIIGALLSIFALVNITGAIRSFQQLTQDRQEVTEEEQAGSRFELFVRKYRVVVSVGLMVVYYVLLVCFGFIIATAVFLPAMLYLLEYRKPLAVILVTIIGISLLYIAFKVLLGVPLPQGIFFS